MKFKAGWAFPDADRFMVDELSDNGWYQMPHLQAALSHVGSWGSAIDGGAHVGTWSRPMALRFTRVVAVEPARDTFECLVFNMGVCPNVECRQAALGARDGRARIALDTANAQRQNTGARRTVPGDDISVVTIDSFDLADVGFIKLDIEGSELFALQGATETLARCRPIVLFENKWMWTKHFGQPKRAVHDLLVTAGYRLLQSVGCDQIWGPA